MEWQVSTNELPANDNPYNIIVYRQDHNLLAASRFDRENAGVMANKMAGVKGRPLACAQGIAATTRSRAALCNISNKTAPTQPAKGLKDTTNTNKPKVLSKNTGTTSLLSQKDIVCKVVPENVPEPLPASPAPMDVSSGGVATPPDVPTDNAFSRRLLLVNDIDSADATNPQLVSVYVNDIYTYMRTLEDKMQTRPHYLEGSGLTGRMRAILVDWLVQVHLRFRLLQETLFLTVAIIDRYLQVQPVSKAKLQLLGVSAMFVASKYEEMFAPEVGDFVYITDNAYTKKDIRRMECDILKTLDFNLGRPLPLHFLRRNSKAGEVDANKHTLAKYLMELTIVDYEMVHVLPSRIAAASLCLAMRLLDNSPWTPTLEHYSCYTEGELRSTVIQLANLALRAGTGKLSAIRTKFQSSKFMKISTIPELQAENLQDLASGNL